MVANRSLRELSLWGPKLGDALCGVVEHFIAAGGILDFLDCSGCGQTNGGMLKLRGLLSGSGCKIFPMGAVR
jgi:hypothetical protein